MKTGASSVEMRKARARTPCTYSRLTTASVFLNVPPAPLLIARPRPVR